jgi:chromate transport protein ChrA
MKKENLDVIGVFLIAIAFVLLICFPTIGNFESAILGIIFGIIGIVLVKLSKKINEEQGLLSVILLLLSAITLIIDTSRVITGIVIIACALGIIFFILKPPDD